MSPRSRTWSARGEAEPGKSRDGTQVDVVVELEAQPQQQPALEDAGRQVRVVGLAADGTQQDRVVPADLREHRVGQHLAGREVALGAEVVARRLELHRRGDLEDLEGLGGHLRADAVAGDDGEGLARCRRGGTRSAGCRACGELSCRPDAWPPLSRRSSAVCSAVAVFSALRGFSGSWAAGPQESGYRSYMGLTPTIVDGGCELEAADTAAGDGAGVRGSPGARLPAGTGVRITRDWRGPAAEAAASSSTERARAESEGRAAEPRQRRTPRRGGLLSGPAAANDKYEHVPHDEETVRPLGGRAHPVSETCQIVRCRTAT